MSDGSTTRTITVADVSEGPGGDGTAPGASVSLPVVELLTGRGFVTGKSGSGKSNTASVIAERLLDDGFPLLIVDVEGEYYGLKEEYELLHAGADDECDIQVAPEHAEKLASLALEQNVPIILDVSGYLDEDVADELVFATARHLFAKEKKLKQPFLLLVEEVHEYIPEGGGTTEAGRMLVKIGKRGRKHGLGLLGISQRPANVKKDYITQCDWICWHRLTWDNDTQVVRRIIDREHAEAVEDLDDGEGFLMTDWSESIRRVQFHRKHTFDAGATPGLDEFERPELKSVDDDLVSELREITDERERRESEIADLKQELERKEARIAELEEELSQARDLERMADRFSQALLDRAGASYRQTTDEPADDGSDLDEPSRGPTAPTDGSDDPLTTTHAGADDTSGSGLDLDGTGEWPSVGPAASDDGQRRQPDGPARAVDGDDGDQPPVTVEETGDEDVAAGRLGAPTEHDIIGTGDAGVDGDDVPDAAAWAGVATGDEAGETAETDGRADSDEVDAGGSEPTRMTLGTRESLVADLTDRIESVAATPTAMLREVRSDGPLTPVEAHLEAGGNADRELAYSRMRELRRAGLVEHVGRGKYAYALPALVREAYDDRLHESDLADVLRAVEESFVDDPVHGWTVRQVDDDDAPDAAVTDPDVEIVDAADDALRPAFREEDAEFVDEGEIVTSDEATDDAREAGTESESLRADDDRGDSGDRDSGDRDDSEEVDATQADSGRSGRTDAGPTTGSGDPRDGRDAEIIE